MTDDPPPNLDEAAREIDEEISATIRDGKLRHDADGLGKLYFAIQAAMPALHQMGAIVEKLDVNRASRSISVTLTFFLDE